MKILRNFWRKAVVSLLEFFGLRRRHFQFLEKAVVPTSSCFRVGLGHLELPNEAVPTVFEFWEFSSDIPKMSLNTAEAILTVCGVLLRHFAEMSLG
jgi:hypothetical protein